PGVTGARALTLDVLPVDDAITLFRRIAGGGRAQDDQDVAAAVELCGRLPLAIQVTAGRLARDYPYRLGDLVAELSRPPALVGGAGAQPGGGPPLGPSLPAPGTRDQQVFPRPGPRPRAPNHPHAPTPP